MGEAQTHLRHTTTQNPTLKSHAQQYFPGGAPFLQPALRVPTMGSTSREHLPHPVLSIQLKVPITTIVLGCQQEELHP